jgi:hypothetical protein
MKRRRRRIKRTEILVDDKGVSHDSIRSLDDREFFAWSGAHRCDEVEFSYAVIY